MRTEIRTELESAIDAALTDEALGGAKKKLADLFNEIHGDFEDRVRTYLAYNLASWTQDMADKAIESFLRGDVEVMRQYLRCADNQWTGRDRDHLVINGRLSEHDPLLLRKQIVQQHADLLISERILDLEDQVKSLVAAVNKLEREKRERYESMREHSLDSPAF